MRPKRYGLSAAIAAAVAIAAAGCSGGDTGGGDGASGDGAHGMPTVTRTPDSAAGRAAFVSKGCVLCHAVNGIGGKAAPALDAAIGEAVVDPLEFSARIWRGAPAMIELQAIEVGYVIDLTADDLANLAAFAADVAEQKQFTIADVPEPMRGSLLDERFWEVEDWNGFLKDGQEGYGEPEADPEPEQPEPQEDGR